MTDQTKAAKPTEVPNPEKRSSITRQKSQTEENKEPSGIQTPLEGGQNNDSWESQNILRENFYAPGQKDKRSEIYRHSY